MASVSAVVVDVASVDVTSVDGGGASVDVTSVSTAVTEAATSDAVVEMSAGAPAAAARVPGVFDDDALVCVAPVAAPGVVVVVVWGNDCGCCRAWSGERERRLRGLLAPWLE